MSGALLTCEFYKIPVVLSLRSMLMWKDFTSLRSMLMIVKMFIYYCTAFSIFESLTTVTTSTSFVKIVQKTSKKAIIVKISNFCEIVSG